MNTRLWYIAAGAFTTWLVPLLVSFGLYDPATGTYLPNYLGFKLIMLLLASAICFASMRWIAKRQPLTTMVPATYVAVNSALDLLLLVSTFGMSFLFWATIIFPIYCLVFTLIYVLLQNKLRIT